ncbi:MAG TPA: HEAT repeat domain-containing protein, partial [Longimicrobium sp.]|nr:HEAT repeat domain-containing protein [Longimicrobium sp.]
DDAGLVTRLGTWAADHHSSEIRAAALEGLAREFADSPGVYELLTRQAAEDPEAGVRATAVALLGEAVRGRPEILDVVGQRALDDPSPEVRKEATLVYAKYLFPSIPSQLLTEDLDGVRPGIDPSEWITRGRVTEVATYLELPEADIRHHYESLIREHQLPLRLEWLGDAAAGEG